ncbi:hypothetical protein OG589_13130 [Sphaerisporangium sp. NBC_01403]|uniref:hypothetical protein n=1 Tax=Sphaerisporangium sp. NBC_01403 TaxID=2903599 RepID=UPI00325335BA
MEQELRADEGSYITAARVLEDSAELFGGHTDALLTAISGGGRSPWGAGLIGMAIGPRGLGSVQLYVDGRGGWRRWTEVERQRGAAFDYVIGNLDRGNNFLTDRNEALRFYDHALSSPTSSESAIRSPFVTNYLDRPLDPGVLADLRGLDLEAEARRLRASGLGMVEIGGRIERLRELRELGMITGRSWRGRIISGVGS